MGKEFKEKGIDSKLSPESSLEEEKPRVMNLTDKNIGDWVIYKSGIKSEEIRGKIKSFDNDKQIAYVVYKCNNNWDGDHWKDYTGQPTKYSNLEKLGE